MPSFLSKYSIEARLIPTIFGLIPFYLWQYFYLDNFIFSEPATLVIIGNITLSFVVLFFISEFIVRSLGKKYEDLLFNNKLNFPTTNLLLMNNKEFTRDYKLRIREKIKNDFSLTLLNEEEESEDDIEARKKIKEAVGLIIGVVKDGHLVLKQNIYYGFARNFWAASIIGLFFSFLLAFFSLANLLLITVALFFAVFYLLFLIYGNSIIKYCGYNYARKIIEEYLGLNYAK